MYTAHYKNKENKVVHFKVNSIAEVANIIDSREHYINAASDLILCDENGIIKTYSWFGSFIYPEFRQMTIDNII